MLKLVFTEIINQWKFIYHLTSTLTVASIETELLGTQVIFLGTFTENPW